jgi:TatD DNase family protein
MLVDVHCHIDMCKRPAQEVVNKDMIIVTNGTDLASNKKVLSYAKTFPNVKAALGLFPLDIVKMSNKQVQENLKFIKDNKDKIIAIGEVGIDFKWCEDEKERKKQVEVFKKIVKLANTIKKPLIVHSWKAMPKVLELLQQAKVQVIMHCFEGNLQLTEEAVKRGYYFTIPANFWKRKGFKNVAKRAPIDRLLTETDSPYLSPTEEENKPENVRYAIDKLAELRGLTKLETENQIYANAKKCLLISKH